MSVSRYFAYLFSFALVVLLFLYMFSDWSFSDLTQRVPMPIAGIFGFAAPEVGTPGPSNSSNIVWVFGHGTTLLERVAEYQEALSRTRQEVLDILKGSATVSLDDVHWRPVSPTRRRVWGQAGDTLYQLQLEKATILRSVALAWIDDREATSNDSGRADRSLTDPRNLILLEYYKWAESQNLCLFKQKTKYKVPHQVTCYPNQTVPLETESVALQVINSYKHKREAILAKSDVLLFNRDIEIGPTPHVFYVHLIPNAIVDGLGDVFLETMKIVPHTCRSNRPAKHPRLNGEQSPLYNEVFVISQFWGTGYFHFNCESAPRLAPYVEFLKAHPHIKIHAIKNGGFTAKAVELLGLDRSRLITGTTRAKLVYLPESTHCGRSNIHLVQLLSHRYRQAIREKFPAESLQRNSIVVIQRSGSRKFKNARAVESLVKSMAEGSGFRYELFSDKPLPPYDEAIQIFNRAVIVVGPHGAGLSNLLFSEPGTVMIEGVCNAPHTNLCYQRLGYVLGHRHHGIGAGPGCGGVVNIDANTIGPVLKIYMERVRQEMGSASPSNQTAV